MDVTTFSILLSNFHKIHEPRKNISFLDISGNSDKENVFSNILSFFIDPIKSHGLGWLFIQSIMDSSQTSVDYSQTQNVKVYREYGTEKNNRIDIVIEGNDFIIGIENKVWAGLNNDLDDYRNSLYKISETKSLLTFVLSPYPLNTGNDKWESITYDQLWKSLKNNLGFYLHNAPHKWQILLQDFIQHTENMTKKEIIFTPKELFLLENPDLRNDINQALHSLNAKYGSMRSRADEFIEERKNSDRDWWNKHTRKWYYVGMPVHDMIDSNGKDSKHAFDFHVGPDGYELELFGRNRKTKFDISSSNINKIKNTGRGWIVYKTPITEPFDVDSFMKVFKETINAIMPFIK